MSCIVIPTLAYDPSLVKRLTDSIDYPINNKVIINNGWTEYELPGWPVRWMRRNLGCAGAWNMAPKLFPEEKWWLIVNEDAYFKPGQLKTLCEEAEAHWLDCHFILADRGFECFIWTSRGLDELGTFDENLWPIYLEDYDMRIRASLAGNLIRTAGCLVNHGKPKTGGQHYRCMIEGTGLFNRQYMYQKWGALDKAMWSSPFNFGLNSIKDWQLDAEGRFYRMALWKAFLAMPNPSVYT